MPKNDPAGYLPSVKKARKRQSRKQSANGRGKGGRFMKAEPKGRF